ncbi:UNVERIFIED_CONTAM: hypothetical protein FKN15_066755 [Acipenser sinensis]
MLGDDTVRERAKKQLHFILGDAFEDIAHNIKSKMIRNVKETVSHSANNIASFQRRRVM